MVDRFLRALGIAALLLAALSPVSAQQSIAHNHEMGTGSYAPISPYAPTPPIKLHADEVDGIPGDAAFNAAGRVDLTGGTEFDLQADEIGRDSATATYRALGNVSLRELDTHLYADSLFFDSTDNVAIGDNIILRQPPYTLQARRITVRDGRADATEALFTTCPPGMRYTYSIRAHMISIYALRRMIIIRHASFYFRGTRLLTIGRIALTAGSHRQSLGPGTGRNSVQPGIGYNPYDGPALTFTSRRGSPGSNALATLVIPQKHSLQGSVVGNFSLVRYPSHSSGIKPEPGPLTALREIAEATEPILPPGDPLLYHDFIDDGPMYTRFDNRPTRLAISFNPALSYRQRIYGRPQANLFLTRQELSFNVVVPLIGHQNLPTDQNPLHVREALKKLALYAYTIPQTGYYHEYPTDVSGGRGSVNFGVDSRPLLISDNTLFRPRVSYQASTYTIGHDSFDYLQYDLALEHYFSDRTGLGVEYIQNFEHGRSPFEFDTPYTTHEIDGRAQVGTSRFILGALLHYDLHQQHLYETQLVLGRNLGCLIPEITYDSLTEGIGVGLEIPGITF